MAVKNLLHPQQYGHVAGLLRRSAGRRQRSGCRAVHLRLDGRQDSVGVLARAHRGCSACYRLAGIELSDIANDAGHWHRHWRDDGWRQLCHTESAERRLSRQATGRSISACGPAWVLPTRAASASRCMRASTGTAPAHARSARCRTAPPSACSTQRPRSTRRWPTTPARSRWPTNTCSSRSNGKAPPQVARTRPPRISTCRRPTSSRRTSPQRLLPALAHWPAGIRHRHHWWHGCWAASGRGVEQH